MQRWFGYSCRNDATGNPAPSCTVTVYQKGTNVLASIFAANSASQPQTNPFTAGLDGLASFYAANGHYDIQFGGQNVVTPYAVGDILLYDPGVGPS